MIEAKRSELRNGLTYRIVADNTNPKDKAAPQPLDAYHLWHQEKWRGGGG
jgi:hypothetical protein